MKLPTEIAPLVALALAVFGASASADLGPKSMTGARVEKAVAPLPVWLGVAIAEVDLEMGARLPIEPGTGLLVNGVMAGSPADVARFQRGDVIARLNDQPLVTVKQLQTLVMRRKPGDQVEVTFFRKGEMRKVLVVLRPRDPM